MDARKASRREIVRRGLRSGIGLTAALSLALAGSTAVEAAATGTKPNPTPIPPNCIYVCCEPSCAGWKMCLKCYDWPKKTTGSVVAQ